MRTSAAEASADRRSLELAFVLPVLLVLGVVILDFGSALDRREVLLHSVREGTRSAAGGAPEAVIVSTVVGQSEGLLDPSDVSVCYVDGPDAGASLGEQGDAVRVSADFTYEFSVGSGELLTAFGVGVPSIGMSPLAEGRLETGVAGASPCS